MALKKKLKSRARQLAYELGVLGAYHRLRNRDLLTVVIFHRVLPPDDPRWAECDPDWTVSVEQYERSLAFFKRHYSIVTPQQVLDARRGSGTLPDHPLLITFDDGWADNKDYALGPLRREGLEALLFVVSDAVDMEQCFWQEALISAWRSGRLEEEHFRRLWLKSGRVGQPWPPWRSDQAIRELIDRLEGMEVTACRELLADVADPLQMPGRSMLTLEELRELAESTFQMGSHGKTHDPMDNTVDLVEEMAGSRRALGEMIDDPPGGPLTFSFPHGRITAEAIRAGWDAGYQLLFTSDPVMNALREGRPSRLLGRVSINAQGIRDEHHDFCPDILAKYLFNLSHEYVED